MKRRIVFFLILSLFGGILYANFHIREVKAVGEIYITADGSISPPTVNITTADNVTTLSRAT